MLFTTNVIAAVVNFYSKYYWQRMTWLWHQSQRQQENNIIAFKNLYAKLCFGRVLKHSLSAHLMRVKLLFIWMADCTDCMQFLSQIHINGCQIFGQFSFFKNWIGTEFRFYTHPYR